MDNSFGSQKPNKNQTGKQAQFVGTVEKKTLQKMQLKNTTISRMQEVENIYLYTFI